MRYVVRTVSEVLAANLQKLSRENRQDLGSQPKIAAKAHVGQRTVGRALKGEVSTTIGSIERIARAFGLQAWELLHPALPTTVGAAVAFGTREQRGIYHIERAEADALLDNFDKLTPAQRRDFMGKIAAAAAENLAAAEHLRSRLHTAEESPAAAHPPPAPRPGKR